MVKVKILKHVGHHLPGDVVEVSHEEAEHLCSVSTVMHGDEVVKHVRAQRLEDYDKAQEELKNLPDLDAAEAAALGVKNIVETPPDPEWEARKAQIEAADAEFLAEKKAKEEAAVEAEGDESEDAKAKKKKKGK